MELMVTIADVTVTGNEFDPWELDEGVTVSCLYLSTNGRS